MIFEAQGEGDCYEVAGRRVLHGSEDLTLVHGVVTGQGDLEGNKFGHAWVEYNQDGIWIVDDNSNGRNITLPRDYYYQLARLDPSEQERYTKEQALVKSMKYGHWGPWDNDHLSPELEWNK